MSDVTRLAVGAGDGPRLIEPGLPEVWADDGQWFGLGHADGALLVGADAAIWAPIPGLFALAGDARAGWWALGEDESGCTAWRIDPKAGTVEPAARVAALAEQLTLVPGGLVIRRAGQSRVIDLHRGGSALRLPLGAERGRVAAEPGLLGLAWADGASLYRSVPGGKTRVAGTASGPISRLWAGRGGGLVGAVGDESGIVAAPGRPPNAVLAPPGAPPVFIAGGRGALLQDEDGVTHVELATGDAAHRWEDVELVGSERAFLDPYAAALVGRDEDVLLSGLLPAAATILNDRVVGPGGAAWDLKTGARVWENPDARAEYMVVVDDCVVAILDGNAVVLRADGTRAGGFALPAPFDDPDLVDDILPAPGGLLIVGEEGSLWVDLQGRLLGGAPPRTPPMPLPPPDEWHWNQSGLLLRLS
jgi:hypothetical protein